MEMLKTLQAAMAVLGWSSLWTAVEYVAAGMPRHYSSGAFAGYIYPDGNVRISDHYGASILLAPNTGAWEITSCGGHWISWDGTQYRTDSNPSLASWGDSALLPEELSSARETRLQKALNAL